MKIINLATLTFGQHEIGAELDPAIGFAIRAFSIADGGARYRGLAIGPLAVRWISQNENSAAFADETEQAAIDAC